MTDLAGIEIDARFFSLWSRELKRRRRTGHAFQLDDVCEVQIAQRALEFLAVGLTGRREEGLDKIDEIAMGKRFFEKVNRAKTRS